MINYENVVANVYTNGSQYVDLSIWSCCDIGIDDEDATKFIYNNGNNASTDNITAGVAA